MTTSNFTSEMEIFMNTNILVVDDDKEIVDAIEIYLMQEQFNVIKAYDGEEAIKKLKENDIHLILLEMEPETWQLGDILRFISVRTDGGNEASVLNVAYSDTVIQSSSDVRYCTISSEPLTPGMYAWVHLRPKSKGMYASTQMLIKI